MKKILLLLLVLALMVGSAFSCFAEEIAEAEDAGLIEQGKEFLQLISDIIIGVISTVKEYSPEDFKQVIENDIIPWITLALSAVLGIYVSISPILIKIKKTSNIFDRSSGKLDEAKETTEKANKELKAAKAEIEALRKEFKAVKDGYDQMYSSLSNIEEIVRIGFENSDELIIKGYANEIAKVGAVDGKKKDENA